MGHSCEWRALGPLRLLSWQRPRTTVIATTRGGLGPAQIPLLQCSHSFSHAVQVRAYAAMEADLRVQPDAAAVHAVVDALASAGRMPEAVAQLQRAAAMATARGKCKCDTFVCFQRSSLC